MNNCDHIIGEWQGVDEGGVMYLSNWNTGNNHYVERFKFCPCCGEEISGLVPKEKVEAEIKHGPVTQAFVDECTKITPHILEWYIKRPSFAEILKMVEEKKLSREN